MKAGYFSAEASVIKDGKPVKGTLSLFKNEYSFGSVRKTVDWESIECERGTVSIKGMFRSVEKQCLMFKGDDFESPRFILEQSDINSAINTISLFVESQRKAREEKALKESIATKEAIDIEAAKQSQAQKQQLEAEKKLQDKEALDRRMAEKAARIRREVDNVKNQPAPEPVVVGTLAKKAASCFLDNPYRILGISCLASNEEANAALDKLKKMARLNALGSYISPFELNGIEKPIRNLSIAQNALVLLKDRTNKFFWFAEPDACIAWRSGKYRIELSKDGEQLGSYDLFIANYLYAILCDPGFNTAETWKRILRFYCFICKQKNCELLRSRFSSIEQNGMSNSDLLNSFRSVILKPIIMLCERDDLDAVIRIHKYIKDCNDYLLDSLARSVLSKLVSWFTDKEADMLNYLRVIDEQEAVSNEQGAEIYKRGEAYCNVVEPVLEVVLRDFKGDTIRYDMIKESYRSTTYQLMYELNRCPNKTNAIIFANKCYGYCNADDKERIRNTFGEANIKAIDWNTPHTLWDAKGDDCYYGRGCSVDYAQAMYWYRKAAEEGNLYSPNSIGICYQKGHGVPQSYEQAAVWFEKAYQAGNPQGAYNLAECYFSGVGVKKNIDLALKYWSEAARLGHPSAAQRREEIFASVQNERRNHRARNHICHDLGFQMTTGPDIVVEVTLNKPANVYLVNSQGYQNYLNGNEFKSYGGYAESSPYLIWIPSSNHWYVIIDNGDDQISGITSSARVKRA